MAQKMIILWDEQHDKSYSDEEGNNRYNRCSIKIVMMMNFGVLNKFADFSASYTQVPL